MGSDEEVAQRNAEVRTRVGGEEMLRRRFCLQYKGELSNEEMCGNRMGCLGREALTHHWKSLSRSQIISVQECCLSALHTGKRPDKGI